MKDTRARLLARGGVAALGGLAVLTAVVPGAPARPEAAVASAAYRFGRSRPGWVGAMRTITRLGDHGVGFVVGGALAGGLIARRDWGRAAAVIVATPVPQLAALLRRHIERPRPARKFVDSTDFSFPSGHATTSTTTALIVSIGLWPYLSGDARQWLFGCAALMITLVSLSRLALAAHWPTDVLGGWLLAIAGVLIPFAAAAPWWRTVDSAC
ncbi:phosphatase PAP2 family protein [Actinokineospora sp.]|uniref:phosphatase PAP2 family protein n=1 Tax=Actinokineospora sp. TaxID=1872133 RepID=UPI0040382A6B